MGDASEARELISLLRRSATDLAARVETLDADALAGRSYDDEWTIAQVLSHLGSGAEIFSVFFEAAVAGEELPGREGLTAVWDVWNAKSPSEQAEDYIEANEALLDQLESFDDDTLRDTSIELFGARRDIAAMVRMRLSEQVVHGWDVAVALDPAAELMAEAVPHLLAGLAVMAERAGKPIGDAREVEVRTSDPETAHLLTVEEKVELVDLGDDGSTSDGAARIEMPAEALVRLVYGRLDPDHTPEDVITDGIELDELRTLFPGV